MIAGYFTKTGFRRQAYGSEKLGQEREALSERQELIHIFGSKWLCKISLQSIHDFLRNLAAADEEKKKDVFLTVCTVL